MLKSLAKSGVNVAVSRANKLTAALLSAYHLLDLIGNERLYPIILHAIAAFRKEMGYYEDECEF